MGKGKTWRYWLSGDRRQEMEQVTFGERVQAFIAPNNRNGVQALSVVYYMNTKNLPKILRAYILRAYFTETFFQRCGPRNVIANIPPSLDIILFHHYLPDKDKLIQVVGSFENGIVELLDQYFSAYLNPN